MRGGVLVPGRAEFAVSDDWLQGRSVFGGLQGAIGVAAMRTLVDRRVPLRTLQVGFIAPIPAGTVRAEARVLRTGKSATQVEARLVDGSDTLAVLTGVFGLARASQVQYLPRRPELTETVSIPMPRAEGAVPPFTQHFSARWLRGDLPFSGDPSRHSAVELALRDPGPCSESHVLVLADFIPPVALSMLSRPTTGSSLTWMLELFGGDPALLPLSGWRVDSEMVAAQDGYTSQSNRLWAPDGQLAALSRQSMVVFG